MSLTWGDKQANKDLLARSIQHLPPQVDLLVVPEMFSTGFITSDKESVRALSEKNSGETIEFLRQLACEKSFALAGSFIAETGGSLFNRAFFVEPCGDVSFADKRHLFSMAGEHNIFSQGDGRLKIRYRGWNIAMVVCYDIRFPVWCRNIGNEYDLLIAVANWPKPRVEAWKHLLRARAIENLAYVCGVNCKGEDNNGIIYDGASFAFDFKGHDITLSNQTSPFMFASLNYEKLESFRNKFPAWKDADGFNIEF